MPAKKSLLLNGDPMSTAELLLEHPNEWFVIAKRPVAESRSLRSAANRLSSRKFVAFEKAAGSQDGHWKVTVRTVEDEVWMYASWWVL